MNKKRKNYNRLALSLSMCMLIIWGILGTGTSLAWFTDTSPEVKNIFYIAEFDLVVSYKTGDGTYKEITSETAIFDDAAIYEPGYTQVVYLKIENKGTVDFQYSTAVSVTDYTTSVNVFGNEFLLQDYLRFGIVTANTEKELMDTLKTRDLAKEKAVMYLNNYASEKAVLGAGKEAYMALIVRMPEAVGNQANYRGSVIPRVELGVIIKANQMNMKE